MKNKWHIEKGVKCYAVLAIIISKESDELCEYLKYSSIFIIRIERLLAFQNCKN